MDHRLRRGRGLSCLARRAVLAVAAAFLLAGAGLAAAQQARIADEADNGGTILLRVGETMALRLPANPSTGYRWSVETHDGTMILVEDGPFRAQAGRVGAGGEASWSVTAKRPGVTTLGLKYWRPWEGEASIVKRFGATLKIAPAQ